MVGANDCLFKRRKAGRMLEFFKVGGRERGGRANPVDGLHGGQLGSGVGGELWQREDLVWE